LLSVSDFDAPSFWFWIMVLLWSMGLEDVRIGLGLRVNWLWC